MEELLIKSVHLDWLEISKVEFDSPIRIVLYDAQKSKNSIFISLDQAKEIRDYLDNILKDR